MKAKDIGYVDFVDLGLSVLWATCNLEAESSEDYGTFLSHTDVLDFAEDNMRIPSVENWEELIEYCDIECTFKFKLGSPEFPREKYGYIFTSRINGNHIFIPCAGIKGELENIFPSGIDADENYKAAALYHTSTLNCGNPIYFIMETCFPPNWCGGGYIDFEPAFSEDWDGIKALPLRLVMPKPSIIWDVTTSNNYTYR